MGQVINMTMKQAGTPSFTVTDGSNNPVPTNGYSASGTVADPSIAQIGSNPTLIEPVAPGSTTVTWTITGKGLYSGTLTLGPDTINVSSIPLGSASVAYTVQ